MKNTLSAAAYAEELKAEAEASKNCLKRIPETLFDFKPHPKSMAMGYLAMLVAEIPLWIAEGDLQSALALKRFEIRLLRCVRLRTARRQLGGYPDARRSRGCAKRKL